MDEKKVQQLPVFEEDAEETGANCLEDELQTRELKIE